MTRVHSEGANWTLYHGDCRDVAALLPAESVSAVVTSPPYAEQRADQYGGIPEAEYPSWTVEWMEAIRPAMHPLGSVMVNIRPNLSDGNLSDYMLHTRLAVRAAGWVEAEELIWHKPDGPPLGSPKRPRRAWESVHWFSVNPQPWVDLLKTGRLSESVAFTHSGRGVTQGFTSSGQSEHSRLKLKGGRQNRCQDIFPVISGMVDRSKWNDHPAQYPEGVPAWLIRLVCPPNGLVLDPFNGAGTTGVAALKYGVRYIGIDRDAHYLDISARRLEACEAAPALFTGV